MLLQLFFKVSIENVKAYLAAKEIFKRRLYNLNKGKSTVVANFENFHFFFQKQIFHLGNDLSSTLNKTSTTVGS